MDSFVVRPIGVARSTLVEKRQAPRQPRLPGSVEGTLELYSGENFEHALEDLESFQFIWVLFWFHGAQGFKPKVLPPRSQERRGLFSTRSPHRPNPIGLSLVELLERDGLSLKVRGLDLIDGTPVLDIKPYLPYSDQIAEAGHGWLDNPLGVDPVPAYTVAFRERAQRALELARRHGVELEAQVRQALCLGPEPHPYRRIRRIGETTHRLALKEFRVTFEVAGRAISVLAIGTGYRPRQLAESDDTALELHRELLALGVV